MLHDLYNQGHSNRQSHPDQAPGSGAISLGLLWPILATWCRDLIIGKDPGCWQLKAGEKGTTEWWYWLMTPPTGAGHEVWASSMSWWWTGEAWPAAVHGFRESDRTKNWTEPQIFSRWGQGEVHQTGVCVIGDVTNSSRLCLRLKLVFLLLRLPGYSTELRIPEIWSPETASGMAEISVLLIYPSSAIWPSRQPSVARDCTSDIHTRLQHSLGIAEPQSHSPWKKEKRSLISQIDLNIRR